MLALMGVNFDCKKQKLTQASLRKESLLIEEPLDEGEKRVEKSGLKLNIQKMKIMASSPITSW